MTAPLPQSRLDAWYRRKAEIQRAWYERHKDKKRAYDDEWRKKNLAKIREAKRKKYDPFKAKANRAIHYATKTGKLEKEPCRDCGEVKVDFHHTNGYDKPNWFVGVWLCRKHHHQAHKELRWGKTNEQTG